MNYAPLVKAIQEGDQETANRMISEATPILIRMLKVRLNASQEDAEDAVQKMFLYIIEAIRDDRIKNPSGLLSYMIISCRHNYLKDAISETPDFLEEQALEPSHGPDQFSNLINKELQKIHVDCINGLRDSYKRFYKFCLRNDDLDSAEIAKSFGISVNNVWTRKHRILKKIRDCVQSKLDK